MHGPLVRRKRVVLRPCTLAFERLEDRRLLSITPEQAGRFGDANLDGIVDGADYTAWADHFGQSGAGYAGGDFNADTVVDAGDYTIWADHFLQAPVLGNPDANGDGLVNAGDYTVWADHFGQTVVGPSQGDFSGDGFVDAADYTIWADNFGTVFDISPPVFTVGLVQDTGPSATDRVTKEPAVAGAIADTSLLLTFRLGLDDQLPAQYANVFGDLSAGNAFSLSRARLEQLFGPLGDGSHTLHFESTDAAANTGTGLVTFTLDTVAPVAPTFNLSATSDTGLAGDLETSVATVTLIGTAEPGSRLTILGTSLTTLASAAGTFQLPGVPLVVGANPFTLESSDPAGNTSQTLQSFARSAQAAQSDVVLDWNHTLLEAIRLDATTPPMASRAMAMVSTAVYDAVSAVDGTPGYLIARTAVPGTSAEAAAAAAAHRVLEYLYPAQQAMLDNQLTTSLAVIPDGAGKTEGIALGGSIADDIIALRNADGWNTFVDYTPGSDVGDWQLTAPAFAPALLPQWADLTPFALSSPEQFRPAGPPSFSSQTWADNYNEVKLLGRVDSATRTADQTQIARFWADGAGTYTPPGHWNQIAAQIAEQQGSSLATNARLFAQLNVAMADSAIASWDAKYAYNFWRPITAIQEGATDGNSQTVEDSTWAPLIMTPPFPEYVSGHSTFSGAAAEVLNNVFGNSVGFTIDSVGLPGVQRTFTNFDQAAAEAGQSRIYGGIHFQFSNTDGQAAGRQVAQLVLDKFAVQTDDQAPSIVVDPIANPNLATNLVLTGSVFDNLTGVAALEAQIDGGAYAPVSFGANGSFSLATSLLLDGSADGAHTVSLRALDAQGNESSPVTFNWRLDTLAPAITLSGPTEGGAIEADSRLTGTANPTGSNLVALCYHFDGAPSMPLLFDAATGAFDTALDLSKLAAGDHTLTVSATDAAGHTTTSSIIVTLAQVVPLTITKVTPTPGASDLGSTFRPQVFFSRAVDTATLGNNNFYATDTTGATLPATIVSAADGTFAWLFLTNPMPGASTITVHVEGTTLLAAADGQALDADDDDVPGGVYTYQFTTVSLAPLPNTSIMGKVVDPGPDFKPMTWDDARAGPDQSLGTPDDVFLLPIEHVKVFIAGRESDGVYTDAQGNFTFTSVPSGDVKVVIDGRTATNAPAGYFFPEMVMDSRIIVGQVNTLMAAMQQDITHAEAQEGLQEVYLPRLATTILQSVSDTQPTTIGVDPISAPNLTPEWREQLTITVQPGSAIGMDGQPLANPQVGISTVPPELVRDMLPPGLLQHTFDITIQAPGAATFATPLVMTFPNVFSAAPGTKLNFLSFDHTTGRLVIEGTATVSADGLSVTTDPGTGITKPGWHGVTPPGKNVGPPPLPPMTSIKFLYHPV